MTNQEFSNEFDILYNNIMSNAAPGINEYEKSVFLTKAQKQVIRAYFEPSQNKSIKGFDDSEKRQYDFGSLINTIALEIYDPLLYGERDKLDSRSILYVAPKDLFLAINESAKEKLGRIYSVLPISYQEYNRLMLRPYAYPPKKQVWRLITSSVNINNGIGYNTEKMPIVRIVSVYNKPITFRAISIVGTLNPEDNTYAPVVTEYEDYVDILVKVPVPAEGATGNAMVAYWNLYLRSNSSISLSQSFKEKGIGWVDSEGNLIAGTKYIKPLDSTEDTGTWPNDVDRLPFTVNIPPAYPSLLVPIYEVIGRFRESDPEYKLRYVRTPKPIILVNLNDIDEALSIDGVSTISECELPVETHEEILQRAVELAKAAYTGDLQSQLALGVNSETNIGMVQTSR